MFGRQSQPAIKTRTFTNFLLRNLIVLGISFALAFYFATVILQYDGFIIIPLAQLLGALIPQANDPFWLNYIMIYALLSLALMFFRYKTGSKI